MLNLSELTLYYINVTFVPDIKKVIFNSFSLLENFGKKFYEDKLIELIQKEDSISSDTKQDTFMMLLTDEVKTIINEHSIFLNKDTNPSLDELNEIANFLYIIQSLEDYDIVSYRLHADDTPRNIIIDIIEHLTLLSKPRLMEMIEVVEPSFVEALKNFITDKQDKSENIDFQHLKQIRQFFKFIEETPCLGLTYFNISFINVNLVEFLSIANFNLDAHIDKLILTNSGQAALDCLSLLMLCKDSYELPMLKFKQNTSYFSSKLENITKLEAGMLHILNDFNVFLTAMKQEETLNAN
jgi:hypothetical protein